LNEKQRKKENEVGMDKQRTEVDIQETKNYISDK